MRYNPATDNAVINERNQADMGWSRKLDATATTAAKPEQHTDTNWAELEQLHRAAGRCGGGVNHNWLNCCAISHDMVVAKAMGNWSEYRRLRAQLIAGLW